MKKIVLLLSAAALTAVLFSACKKDDNNDADSVNDRIRAKWDLNSITSDDYFGGDHNRDTTTFTGAEYVEFRSDNRVVANFGIGTDTSAYTVLDNSRIIIDTDTFSIATLNNNSLVLYQKDIAGANYFEQTINLSK